MSECVKKFQRLSLINSLQPGAWCLSQPSAWQLGSPAVRAVPEELTVLSAQHPARWEEGSDAVHSEHKLRAAAWLLGSSWGATVGAPCRAVGGLCRARSLPAHAGWQQLLVSGWKIAAGQ